MESKTIDRKDAIHTALQNGYISITNIPELELCENDDDFRMKILSFMMENVNNSGVGEMTMEIEAREIINK